MSKPRTFRIGLLVCVVCSIGAFTGIADAATITVNTTADVVSSTDGHCSLREAITSVNNRSASGNVNGECTAGDGNNDTIIVPAGTYTLTTLGSDEDYNATGDLDLRASVRIQGAGQASTIIDASGFGATPDRVFDVPVGGISVTLQDLAITNGHAPDGSTTNGGNGEDGGGLRIANGGGGNYVTLIGVALTHNQAGAQDAGTPNSVAGNGGGIADEGATLGIIQSLIANNRTVNGDSRGGGVYAFGNVTIDHSRVDANTVYVLGRGGGLDCETCILQASQSSFTRNSAGAGGGIYLNNALPSTIANSTIAQNTMTLSNGAGIYAYISSTPDIEFTTISGNNGDGVYIQGSGVSITYRSSIISGNTTDCVIGPGTADYIVSAGYNLMGSGCLTSNGPSPGTSTAPGNIATTQPKLGPLTLDDSGLTNVMLPQPDSPATNAGSCTTSELFVDQRGHVRPATVPRVSYKYDGCDMGAAELDDDIFWDGFEN